MLTDRISRNAPFGAVLRSTTALTAVSRLPVAALVLIELGPPGLIAAGVAAATLGDRAPWFVLAAVAVGFALRAIDLESCALFVPGGLYGSVKLAFGRPAGTVAASLLFVETVAFAALAASAAGYAIAALVRLLPPGLQSATPFAAEDTATTIGVAMIGAVWWWVRQGRPVPNSLTSRAVASAVLTFAVVVVTSFIRALGRLDAAAATLPTLSASPRAIADALIGVGFCLFAAGSAETLSRAAIDAPQPKIHHLRRSARWAGAYMLLITAGAAFLFVRLVPSAEQRVWSSAPIAGLLVFPETPGWLAAPLVAVVAAASFVVLGLAVHRQLANAQQLLVRLSEDGFLSPALRELHPRFGTPSRLIGAIAIAQLVLVLSFAGQLSWLTRACSVAIAGVAVLKTVTLIRLRRLRPEPRAFRLALNLRLGGRETPLGLAAIAVATGAMAISLVATGDPPALTTVAFAVAATVLLTISERAVRSSAAAAPLVEDPFSIQQPVAVGFEGFVVRPGNILVAVRRPGVLAHLATALRAAADREVVVMTARLVGVDASDARALDPAPTADERRLLSGAAMLAERHGRAVRLLIVPATNAFEAVAESAARLRSAEIYVGESETLTADDQARRLGQAWERTPKPALVEARLVILHSSGRTAVYHLGAHAPSLTSADIQLIHEIWLEVVKAVGPHVHHHDVLFAALKHMDEQLNAEGPPRDAILDRVRQIARPADELAAVVRQRDFARLRDMVRNRPPSDLATLFTDLTLEDQVITFRVLPRKAAAGIFEYLSEESQKALLKAMAQEDVAALLNNMAPDDRTAFLEELPASATQQLLALLTPQERSVAVTLLGYPEHSIGRLMTPDYIAVRENWTVAQVLEHVRLHGHDSETLNVIYVVDDHGTLIDDIRIRELLLTPLETPISALMDRRFVALNAADDQNAAVATFRREDRSALPVTDSTGVLIGIVTIDDVLDVAEAAATREIQRIGGSEALDEPYMRIAFGRMIQKRAGWLTALFLGEMLTATAMGAFEREIERAVVLALFVPLIISSGGNSGSQASTLVIRAIALGEVQLRDWWRVIRREVGAGLALGAILGSIGFLRITLWSAFSNLYGPHWMLVAVTVALALVGVVLWGTLIGSLLPFILRRLGFDPAASSAPFVATLVDVTGLVIYFTVGLVVLHGTLL